MTVSETQDTAAAKTTPKPERLERPLPVSEKLLRMPVVLPLFTFVLILIVWEAGTRLFSVPSFVLPAPSRILGGFESVTAGRWMEHIWATLRVALIGYAVSFVISLPIAVGLAKSRLLSGRSIPCSWSSSPSRSSPLLRSSSWCWAPVMHHASSSPS